MLNEYLIKMAGDNPSFKILSDFKKSKYFKQIHTTGPETAFKMFLLNSDYNIPLTRQQIQQVLITDLGYTTKQVNRYKDLFSIYSKSIYKYIKGG